jgi:hypothetical protein
LLAAGLDRRIGRSPPRQWSLPRQRTNLFPPLRVRSRVAEQEDYKWILSEHNTIDTWQLVKIVNRYLEDSTSCTFRLRTTRRPCGTGGRVVANSTAGPGELSFLTSPSVPVSARGLPPFMDSLLCRATAFQALFASTAGWEEGGLAAGCPATAGSCGITPCVPAEGAQLAWARWNLFLL